MTTYIFTPPTVDEGPTSTNHRLFQFFRLRKGISIGKLAGSYFQNRYPAQDDIDTYSEFYAGGHKHSVSEAIKTALIAANVGVTEANFTIE